MNLIKGYSGIFRNVVVRIPQNMENVDFLTPNFDFVCQSLTYTILNVSQNYNQWTFSILTYFFLDISFLKKFVY